MANKLKNLFKSSGATVPEMAIIFIIMRWSVRSSSKSVIQVAYEEYGYSLEISLSQFKSAFRSCEQKKLIQIVTNKDIYIYKNDLKRRKIPNCDNDVPDLGDLYVTRRGMRMYRKVDFKGSGWRAGEVRSRSGLTSTLYAPTKRECLALVDWRGYRRQDYSDTCRGLPLYVKKISEPTPCKAWRLSRYETFKSGYSIKVIYKAVENKGA